jgi:hypothetical protein
MGALPAMGEHAHRQITEVRSARFHISRRNFSAPINVRLRATSAQKIEKKKKIKQEMKAGAPTVNARAAYRGSLYRVERG